MDRGAWWPIVHGVTRSWERLRDLRERKREREKCHYLALELAANPEHPLGPLSLRRPASFHPASVWVAQPFCLVSSSLMAREFQERYELVQV